MTVKLLVKEWLELKQNTLDDIHMAVLHILKTIMN